MSSKASSRSCTAQSHYLYLLKTDSGERFSLHFAHHPPGLLSGTKVRARGLVLAGVRAKDAGEADGAIALDGSGTSLEILEVGGSGGTSSSETTAAVLPNTFGAQKTVVILVNFQDKPTEQPWTVDQARSVMFGTLSDYFRENSYGQAWLSGEAYGWYTIALDSTNCDTTLIANKANSAAMTSGVDLSAYTRYVYIFPRNSGCTWSGVGTVGGSPSQAWIHGTLELKTIGHELGHNFGLQHSHALECGATTLGANCQTYEYGDHFDIMGNYTAGHLNAFQKAQLGWLGYGSSPPITTVEASGAYFLEPYELGSADAKALKILKAIDPVTGVRTWYYLEYRQALGFDSFLAGNANVLNGIVFHTGTDSDPRSSFLLDITPESTTAGGGYYDWEDPALAEGRTYSDPDAGVTITTAWTDGGGATVDVDLGAPACVRANPGLSLSPSSQSVSAGTPVSYSLTVTNNDNPGCSAASFDLQASVVASGWTATFAASTLTLSPGASASTTLTVTSPASAPGGSYTVGVTATNSNNTAYSAATSATYVVVSSLNVSVSTDKPSYSPNQSVINTANVSASGSPLASASVTFTITKSNGAVLTKTVTTGTDGSAVFKFKLKPNDPTGTYQVRVDAAKNPLSGSAATSFAVQ